MAQNLNGETQHQQTNTQHPNPTAKRQVHVPVSIRPCRFSNSIFFLTTFSIFCRRRFRVHICVSQVFFPLFCGEMCTIFLLNLFRNGYANHGDGYYVFHFVLCTPTPQRKWKIPTLLDHHGVLFRYSWLLVVLLKAHSRHFTVPCR
jgi:hypothetical protein